MSTEDEKEYRSRRVQRFKYLIMTVLCVLLLSPSICSVFLTARVIQLDNKIDAYQNQLDAFLLEQQEETTRAMGAVFEPEPYEDEYEYEAEFISGIPSVAMEEKPIEGKCVYLTFDDGPSSQTQYILDILKAYQIKATFFVLGDKPEQYDDLYNQIVLDGHTIALHSYTHNYNEIYQSPESLQTDILKIQDKVRRLTGVESYIYRFPGGSSNSCITKDVQSYIQMVNQMGLTYYDWNISSGDTGISYGHTAEEMVYSMIDSIEQYNQSMVLFHDSPNKVTTMEALPILLERLQEMDVTVLPIDEYTNTIQHIIHVDTNE